MGIEKGFAALKAADWAGARAAFEDALRQDDTPEAHDGLGIALWWLNEIDAAHEQRNLAFQGFKRLGEIGRAARIACWLGREQVFLKGNVTAMQGWFARAERLLETAPPSIANEWVRIFRASMTEPPEGLKQIALATVSAAALYDDPDLEAFALAFCGSAEVQLGRVDAGMARLDEAMTMTTGGETRDYMVISEVFCVMLSACETAGDLARSEHWCAIASEFAERHHCPFLSAYCRTTYGSLLTAMGRWNDAESALTEALNAFDRGHKGLRVHAVIRLADLRVSQGRFEEAEVLLAGLEDQGAALIPLARLSLSKGETEQARAVLEQALTSVSGSLNRVPAMLLLTDVLLRLDDIDAAVRVTGDLIRLAEESGSGMLTAQAELAQGRILRQNGGAAAAKDVFTTALRRLQAYQESLLAGQIRLEMARALLDDDPHGAVAWAKAALATFERIGARRDALEAGKLLRGLGASSGGSPRSRQPLTAREQEILAGIAQGLTNREIAERLVISAKTVEHHVSSILGKLNLRSRAEAAALAASGKLEKD